MEQIHYHLLFEGFLADTNKTAIGLSLKDELSLNDTKLADLMANRPCVLKNNLTKEDAIVLGRKLTKQGLKVKAKALATNQKDSPDELRKHLQDGGLAQYFASRYRHKDDEMDTILSLAILAMFPILNYILLPIVGLFLILPLIAISAWVNQPIAALFQLILSLACFIPLVLLWPAKYKPQGIELEPETEELLFHALNDLTTHLNAPKIVSIHLTNSPHLKIHQTPIQWARKQASFEIGYPILESLNMKQLVGLMTLRISPHSTPLYAYTWGAFLLWYETLISRQKRIALKLNSWVQPIHQHQTDRSMTAIRTLVGHQEMLFVVNFEKRLHKINEQWPDFSHFCARIHAVPTHWKSFIVDSIPIGEKIDNIEALFRIDSPALWLLSTMTGYQKSLSHLQTKPLFSVRCHDLWHKFELYRPIQNYFSKLRLQPQVLIPPQEASTHTNPVNTNILSRQAKTVTSARLNAIEASLGIEKTPAKDSLDYNAEARKWRSMSADYWPANFLQHPQLPLAKATFQALQTVEQINNWLSIDKAELSDGMKKRRDQQTSKLYQQWIAQIQKLPPLPAIPSKQKSFYEQLQESFKTKVLDELTAGELKQNAQHWLDLSTVYWTFILGQILSGNRTQTQKVSHEHE